MSDSIKRHRGEDPALEGATDSLRAFVQEGGSDHLSEAVKARHRADLLALTSSMTPSSSPSTSSAPASRWGWLQPHKNRIFVFAGVLAVFVLILNLSLSAFPIRRGNVVTRLLVPASNVASAFVLEPAQAYPGGIDLTSGWTLTSNVPASREAIERAIKIEPSVALRVEPGKNADSWRIVPEAPLQDDVVYRVTLATAIQEGEQELPYEYAWAQQTVGAFRAEGFTPAPQSSAPRETAIEVTFSHEDLLKPDAFFSIQPQVEGRFEVRGKTVAFLPKQPLEAGRVYEVRWKAGFGVQDTPSMQLKKDIAYTFQAAIGEGETGVNDTLYLPKDLQTATEQDIVVPMNSAVIERKTSVQVRLYPVSVDQAKQYLAIRGPGGSWFYWARALRNNVANLVKDQSPAATLTLTPSARYEYGYTRDAVVSIPKQPAGMYLAAVSAVGSASADTADWTLIQVSDVAVYATTDRKQLMTWSVDSRTKQPLSDAKIRFESKEAASNTDGVATMTLPEDYAARVAQATAPSIAEITAKGQTTLVVLGASYTHPWSTSLEKGGAPVYEDNLNTWVALSIDRSVQRRSDTLHFSGIAADRLTKQAVPALTARITVSLYGGAPWGGWWGAPGTVIDERSLALDGAGRFSGEFSWKDRTPGNYTLELVRDGKIIDSRSFEIRTEAKPTTHIALDLDRGEYLAGDSVLATVTAEYTDGTRYPNAEIEVVFQAPNQGAAEAGIKQTVKTDARGVATARFATKSPTPCRFRGEFQEGGCYGADSFSVSARLKEASEGEVGTSQYAVLHASRAQFVDVLVWQRLSTGPTVAPVQGSTAEMTLGRSQEAATRTPYANAPLSLDLFEEVKTRISAGTQYNAETKTVEQLYSWTISWNRVQSLTSTSDAQGRFRFELVDLRGEAAYRAIVTVRDREGRSSQQLMYLSPISPEIAAATSNEGGNKHPEAIVTRPTLSFVYATSQQPIPYDGGARMLALGGSIDVATKLSDYPSERTASKPLYLLASRGIVEASLSDKGYRVSMNERTLPNVSVVGVVYTDQGFITDQIGFSLDTQPYGLDVRITPSNTQPKPGEAVEYAVEVRDRKGAAVPNTQVVISMADKALESMGAFYGSVHPLERLYRWTDSGITESASTHKMESLNAGAEGGGGAMGDVLLLPRVDFKDQAAYLVGSTDAAGKLTLKTTLPDNITTWRVEVSAITDDLRAGWLVDSLVVSKPLAIEAVIPKVLAVGDKPSMKLLPRSNELSAETTVEYIVDAPTLGIKERVLTSKGYTPVYLPLAITADQRGLHTMKVGIRAKGEQDAMQFELWVIEQVPTKTIWEQADVQAGFRLPETMGQSGSVMILSRAKAALLPEVQNLVSWTGSSPRLERALADQLGQAILAELGSETQEQAYSFADYQQPNGGFSPLTHASGEIDASFAVAFSGLEVGDTDALAKFFSQEAADTDKIRTRLTRLKAVSGLALLGKPALASLRQAAELTDLTESEEAVLLRTFARLGMRTEAQVVFDRWMKTSETRDGGRFIKRASEQEGRVATRIATYAAYVLRDERREELVLGMQRTPSEVFDPILDAHILEQRVAQAPNEEVKIRYTLGDKTHEVSLNEGSIALSLHAEEWTRFSIETIEGSATIQWQRRVPGVPTSAPGISIQRYYQPVEGVGLPKEGDLVRVTLQPRLSSRDTYGCYEVRDHLPANLAPMGEGSFQERGWWPAASVDGEVGFVACGGYQDAISYTARVIIPGTFTAPAPLVQHLETPSLAAVGVPTEFVATPR